MRKKARGERLVQSVQEVLAEKRALLVKEKGLIKTLNRVLTKIGYEAVPTDSSVRPVRRRGRRRGQNQDGPAGGRRRLRLRGAS